MCSSCERAEAREFAATLGNPQGAVAQLAERHTGSVEVASSILVSSTLAAFATTVRATASTIGGLVAGEGSFIVTQKDRPYADGSRRKRFVFQVALATRDRPLLEAIRNLLSYGSITDHPPRKANWQPMSALTISSIKAHRAAVIPFAESYLPREAAKWQQFVAWREALQAWDEIHPALRVRSTCSEPDCDRPVRGRGVCRIHYYRLTGY